jgi:hypothetical protein
MWTEMPYGVLTQDQRIALATYVVGEVVVDVGAGDLSLSRELLVLGAQEVIAVEPVGRHRALSAGVRQVASYVEDFKEKHSTAFISWPGYWYDRSLSDFCQRTAIVIILAKTTDGIMCGSDPFWKHLCEREVLAYVPNEKNTLTVYGEKYITRAMTGLERGGLSHNVLWYKDTENA